MVKRSEQSKDDEPQNSEVKKPPQGVTSDIKVVPVDKKQDTKSTKNNSETSKQKPEEVSIKN